MARTKEGERIKYEAKAVAQALDDQRLAEANVVVGRKKQKAERSDNPAKAVVDNAVLPVVQEAFVYDAYHSQKWLSWEKAVKRRKEHF
jgi:hypothetical protein